MEKKSVASGAGLIAAVLASLCCIGPVIAVSLGVGSIAAFSVFEAYRSYLIGLTVVLVGLAFYLTYRKREIKCEDGTCKIESASRWAKTGVWSVTIVAVFALGFPYVGFAPHNSVNKAVDSTAVVTLNITGMDCKACAVGIEGSLAGIMGVRKARVDFESGKTTIEYDNRTVNPTVFVERVSESGFSANIEKGK